MQVSNYKTRCAEMCMMSWSSILNDDVKQVVFERYRKSLTEKIKALSTSYNWFKQIHRQISVMPYNWTCDEGFHKHFNEEFRKHCDEELRNQFKLPYWHLEVGMSKKECRREVKKYMVWIHFEIEYMQRELDDFELWKVDVLKQARKRGDNDAISTKKIFLLNNPFLVKI